ncbi:MAG: UDP-N-acetylglucosamine 2-epimerase (hydrolyzing) [Peptococcaceae bacterium]|nr:UDP-N-acetylglucosamine 2-epimerase (hydrolyzing) [Peptococcaceae bacterium]
MKDHTFTQKRKKICVITGTRADYGLLYPLLTKLAEDDQFDLKIAATGMHLSPEFGLTYKEIKKDGFNIDVKIENLLSSDTNVGISKSISLGISGFADYFEATKPDMIVVLGDRYETFAACVAAMTARIPIAHLHGGETTEGMIDEAIRHSITKMSFLHFTSTEEYRKRVIQLGENPERVFNVGAIGIENINKMQLLSKEDLEKDINFKLDKPYILVTFHPVTLENNTAQTQFSELLKALNEYKEEFKIIFTKANADTDGRIINSMIDEYVARDPVRSIAFTSMGQIKYLSAMKYTLAVVGNSSSGIIEAPSFNIPTINIGDRQKGRIQAKSVINCDPYHKNISKAIKTVQSETFRANIRNIINPYGNGNVSEKIVLHLKDYFKSEKINIKKSFFDLN